MYKRQVGPREVVVDDAPPPVGTVLPELPEPDPSTDKDKEVDDPGNPLLPDTLPAKHNPMSQTCSNNYLCVALLQICMKREPDINILYILN